MDLKQIHELIKIINKSNIGEISIEDKDGKVTIKQKEEAVVTVAAPQPQVYTTAAAAAAQPAACSGPLHRQQRLRPITLITVKSPMIGTFYRPRGAR
jgi:acetyl-CoA carboxylase biotin carboxyl carrier protein